MQHARGQGRPAQYGQARGGRTGGRAKPSFNPLQFIHKTPVAVEEVVYEPVHTFETFGLARELAARVIARGHTRPTPIQDQIIPRILEGHDVIGLAETGTGKTAAFLLPLIHKTLREPRRQTLIMAPTRELATQINEELRALSHGMRIFSVVCVGGVNINPQIHALRRRNHFVIGTPGRLLDLMRQKHYDLRDVTTVVLDEADRMLDMGFINDMRTILGATPKSRETLFFSATMPVEARRLVNDFLRDPVEVSVKKQDVTKAVKQDVIPYEHASKYETLVSLLREPYCKRVLIFGAMKHSVERLAKQLNTSGIRAESIHGNKNHSQRQRALERFKRGEAQVLVATDVAARGIHVDDVTHVVNYDLPNTFEDYVHRIGRTGRGTKRGIALTFVPVGA